MPPPLQAQVGGQSLETQRQMERVWEVLGQAQSGDLKVPDTDAAWEDLQQRIQVTQGKAGLGYVADRRASRGTRRVRFGLSATIMLAACVLFGLWLWRQPIEVTAPHGAQTSITLPDGSQVALNSGSQLVYRRGFREWPLISAHRRTVTLEGEAFFEVVRSAQPLVVETFNARVEVLGTQFNVWARPEPVGGGTRVVLASGKVRITDRASPTSTLMLEEAGAVGHVRRATAEIISSHVEEVDRALAWREQGFSAVDQPLASVLAEVERRFDISIEVEAGIALTESMTLFYGPEATAAVIIHDLCLAQGCQYRKVSRGYVLIPPQAEL